MSFVHGKKTKVLLNAIDISAFLDSFTFGDQSIDVNETTTFGATYKTYLAGYSDGTSAMTGKYDGAASAIDSQLSALIGADPVPLVYHPEGLGTGKPTKTVQVVLTSYSTSAPVGDVVTFSAGFQFSSAVVRTVQV
jgi:hypothetical protein